MRIILMITAFMLCVTGMAHAKQSPISAKREAEIRGAVAAYVREKTDGLGCEARIKRLLVNGNPTFPAGTLNYEIIAPQQWEGWGSAGLSVIVRQAGQVVRNLSVRVDVEALTEMVVTTRQIDRGSVLSDSDLAIQKKDLADVRGRYLGRIEDAIGKKAKITLKANSVLRNDQLEKIPIIKTGQLVTIVVENESMKITATGKAKSSGCEGDIVSVQNLHSLKILPARVLDSGTVQIAF